MIARCLLAGLALAALTPSPTGAAEATEAGWWTTSPMAVAPDAQGALVVQGGLQADQPQAYAAVQFALGTGESAARLRLSVAPGSASTSGSTLTVCPLTTTFTPVDGGAMASAPGYDCTASATAAPDSAGAYSIDVTALDDSGVLALAILPGAVTDRVVLAKPTGTSLDTVRGELGGGAAAGDSGGPGAEGDGAVNQGPMITPPDPGAPSTWSFESDSFGPPDPELPAGPDEAPGGIAEAPSSPPAPASAVLLPAASTRDDDSRLPAIALGGLALLAAGLWLTAGRMAEELGSP